jgi:FkbM family methyltransferase
MRHLFRRIAEEDRPLRFLASRLLWRSGLSHRFSVERQGGPGTYRIRFFPSAASSQAWVYPGRLSEEEAFVARTLRPGDCYVDVGANVGLLALRAAAIVGTSGHVVAIEAHPRTSSFLEANVRLNGFQHVEVERVAVGDAPGEIAFTDRRSDDQNSVAPDGAGPVRVPVTTLDALLPVSRLPHVHLLKMDVEGYELAALRGASLLLRRVDRVLFESSPALCARFGYRSRDVLDLLRAAGYRLRPLDDASYLPDDYEPTSFVDLVAERSR